jgi:hypothetical protein
MILTQNWPSGAGAPAFGHEVRIEVRLIGDRMPTLSAHSYSLSA